MQLKSNQGIAMIAALMLLMVASGIMTLMLARSASESRHSGDDAAIVQSLMLARGGANMGGSLLQNTIRDRLQTIIEQRSSTTNRWSFGSGTGSSPTPDSVIRALSDESNSVSVGNLLQTQINNLICNATLSPSGSSGTITLRIYVTPTACGNEVLPAGVQLPEARFVRGNPRGGGGADGQTFALPFAMIAQGGISEFQRRVVLQGEYQFTVGRTSFAKYALFTNVHQTSNGGQIWFTDDTLFDGPVHTNQYFRYYRQPWFGGEVTSAGCSQPLLASCRNNRFNRKGAEFYAAGFIASNRMTPSPTNPSYSNRYGRHEPALTAGVDWGSDFVPLPQNALDQRAAAQSDGLYFAGNLYSLTLQAVDSNLRPVSGGTKATYQLIQACRSRRSCTTYRLDQNNTLQVLRGHSWQTLTSNFNGVLYAAGRIKRFTGPGRQPSRSTNPDDAPPAIASFAQLTVVSENYTRITGDLKYEDPPCQGNPVRDRSGRVTPANCNNLGAKNVLGVYTAAGDILIGNNNRSSSQNAPDNVTVDGVLMSGRGVVTVEDYYLGYPRGNVSLLGGIIEYYYGAFGTFDARSGRGRSGYGRRFTYDRRMAQGFAPPFFPTVGQDGVKSVLTISFGQREQVF